MSLRHYLYFLSLLFLLSLSFRLQAAELQPFSATYSAKFNGFSVTAKRELSGSNDSWRLDFRADSIFAKIREYSRFASSNSQLTPQHYEYHKTGLGRDRHTVLNFEPNEGRVVNLSDAEHTLENTPEDIQDKISYQLQLALDVAEGDKDLKYQVADGKKIREYRFAVTGTEKLQTPLGEVNTVLVERIRDGGAERETKIWFAPQWNYALVKLMQTEEDGKSYQISLTKLIIDGKTISID
ncbi:DUF3108 domain-containing protein [Microbulbifer thermotolerans]|uniref:DUF3108 domain-containing protein n=1 Tax=Microbulbifer thermotolerans TaxID=252514 RepID=A0AB35HZM1_MICTH|nr:DUF3108 domain-containing protein [Microbulbifer thermotolerans]MCX2794726.1 DUF3108 domain-containing protein [Microbulbifer thermotolerans]MCX2802795.1 DUF3108 domain-containing protein [Microbulbifer thermotolerans]MCX2834557.1 DUF3108 domain-containing protein [Microbulbifer thermotolerans]